MNDSIRSVQSRVRLRFAKMFIIPALLLIWATGAWAQTTTGFKANVLTNESNKYDITFKAFNNNTIDGTKATVKVDETPASLTDGKVTNVKVGSIVTITATGYLFSFISATKGTGVDIASINGAKTVVTFTMPDNNVTVSYRMVRDLSVQTSVDISIGGKSVTGNTHLCIAQSDNAYIPISPLTYSFYDQIEDVTKTPDQMVAANVDPVIYLKGDDETSWTPITDINPQTMLPNNIAPNQTYCMTLKAKPNSNYYGGETAKSFEFTLTEGYPVRVSAGQYITYYRDQENLYVEDGAAKLYTITAVSGSTATATEIASANKGMPFLIYNSSEETKTFVLIPTTAEINQAVYGGFKGTTMASTIAASSGTKDNYVFNGKQFVLVKNAISIGANKAWLEVPKANNARTLTLVFGETTGISLTPTLSEGEGALYDLNGRKLDKMPTKKGVYIMRSAEGRLQGKNGQKVVIK